LPGPSPIAESWTRRSGFSAYDDDSYDDNYGDVDAYTDLDDGEEPPTEHVADVLETVSDILVDVIGPEYLLDLEIGIQTRFDEDLEIESLEFVALAERLLHHYGGQVDFVAWLATMELDEIIALTVGDLVKFIVVSTKY